MAKKSKKAKPAKKVAKPAKKKAVAKKSAKAPKARKKEIKKTAKKAAKPAAKKVIAKKKPVKKKAVKKTVAKKVAKPVKKVAKKVVAKTKVIAVKKVAKKPVAAVVAKPVNVVKEKIKKTPLPKQKEVSSIDMDEEEDNQPKQPMITYEPSVIINRPNKLNPVIPKPQINKDKRTRYSDKELQEFKQIILGKLEEAQKDYELLKSTLSHKDDHGTDDTSPTFKLLEDGSDVSSKEETTHLAARQEKFIQNLQNALIRIQNKTYGICRATGKLISKERLRSVPHATLSIDAKLEQTA